MKKQLAVVITAVLASTTTYAGQALPDLGKTGVVSTGTAFNPAISVILDGSFYRESTRGSKSYSEALSEVTGFGSDHDHGDHDGESLVNGFNLNHAEIVMSASVDHYFDALLNLGVSEHGMEIEEAYGVTRNLPAGLQLKMGKFYSGIGYQNSQHAHAWDFADMALPYRLIFGEHGLNEKGMQLTWTPATRNYTLVGFEALQGENELLVNYGDSEKNYTHGSESNVGGPRLFTAFAKFSPNMGHDHALQIGLFAGQSQINKEAHGSRIYEGKPMFIGTDWVYKYDGGGHLGHRNLTVQAEYIYREFDAEVVATTAGNEGRMGERRKYTQDAIYLQGVYGVAPRWQAGLRYELAGITNQRKETIAGATTTTRWNESDRITASVTWLPTEFSKLRLQAGQSRLSEGDEREDFRQVFLQYQLSLGVHGAHRF